MSGTYRTAFTYAKVSILGTVYFAVLAVVYGSIVYGLPETFPLRITPTTSATAPEVVIPALVMFAVAVGIALEAHVPRESKNA